MVMSKMNWSLFLLLLVEVQLLLTQGEISLDVDSVEVDFRMILNPCFTNKQHIRHLFTSKKHLDHDEQHQQKYSLRRRLEDSQVNSTLNHDMKPEPTMEPTITPSLSPTAPPSASPTIDEATRLALERLERLKTIQNQNDLALDSAWFDQMKVFPDFHTYLEHHVNISHSRGLSTQVSPADLWLPVHSRHSSKSEPHVYFNRKTHHTSLMWCDEHDHVQDDRVKNHERDNFEPSGGDNDKKFESHDAKLWKAMHNRRLMIVGDSILRYQYLDLIYFLTHQTWNHDEQLANERLVPNGWPGFYSLTNNMSSQGMELCECYRLDCCNDWTVNENRKYHNPIMNTTVWYFQWFGDVSYPHGHFSIEDDIQPLDCMPNNCHQTATNHSWSSSTSLTAGEFIFRFVETHHPDHVILNSGLHRDMSGKNEFSNREGKYWKIHKPEFSSSSSIYDETSDHSHHPSFPRTKFIFRSTTSVWHGREVCDKRENDLMALQLAVNGLWEYWDVATVLYHMYVVYRKVELAYYFYSHGFPSTGTSISSLGGEDLSKKAMRGFNWDTMHYHPWVYHELNKLLIRKYYLA